MIYKYGDATARTVIVYPNTVPGGIHMLTTPGGLVVPDDEIPNLISALQDYMSRRAKELSRAANESR